MFESFTFFIEEIVLKIATNWQSGKGFLKAPKYVPKGLSAPSLEPYALYISFETYYRTRFQVTVQGPLVLWF